MNNKECKNCGKSIHQSEWKNKWFHENGMSNCDGYSYRSFDEKQMAEPVEAQRSKFMIELAKL